MSASPLGVSADLPGFHLDARTKVYVRASSNRDERYRDGSEAYVKTQIDAANDVSTGSEELSASIRDFASRYHLSAERANLLRPVQHLLRGRIAEIGAGCGAITRFLGETGAQVVAIEATFDRAITCRSRCRDLENVSVVAGELSELRPADQFDVVIAIGVLEYSQTFMGGRSGPRAFLDACKALLKPGGHLILAIENQLGLKYFAGAPEDHLNEPYLGIEGRYSDTLPVTFGKRELRKLIKAAGWTRQQFLYPFPDYKFPAVVVGAEALEDWPELVSSVLRFTPGDDPSQSYYASFPEETVWPTAIRNGLAQRLANSFLVIASDGQGHFKRCPVQIYSTRRRRPFAKVTVIDLATSDLVRRTSLYPGAQDNSSDFFQRVEDEPFVPGKTLSEALCEVLNQPGWTVRDITGRAEPWVLYLRSLVTGDKNEDDPLVGGGLLDCIPANLTIDAGGEFHRFDQEWVCRSPIPLSRIVVRGLFDIFMRVRSVAVRGDGDSGGIFDLVVECAEQLGFTPAREKVAAAIAAESSFQQHVSGQPRVVDVYNGSRFPCIRRPELIRKFNGLSQSDTESEESLALSLIEARQKIERLEHELGLIRCSRSYRLSRLVARFLGKP